MQLSYWEHQTWFSGLDFTVIGSGIVGLNCALQLKERYPKAKLLVLERAPLPQGASTKNAGFACFGSLSELLDDLRTHSREEVVGLVQKRWEGIALLRKCLGDRNLGYQRHGGHEIFESKDTGRFEACLERMGEINGLLEPVFGQRPFTLTDNRFGFEGVHPNYITHGLEGQLDTGRMMRGLIHKCQKLGIPILNGVEVVAVADSGSGARVDTGDFSFGSQKVFVATNGFASKLLPSESVRPARAQVLVTRPIPGLKIKGTFHMEAGYYYFRNVGDRILLGGGRNLDFKTEETTRFGETPIVQQRLEELLRRNILPGKRVTIERRWSGIMGLGTQKMPLVKALSDAVFCGVRLGGMGVALGSQVGKELAQLAD